MVDQNFAVNRGFRSETMEQGRPKRQKTWSKMRRRVPDGDGNNVFRRAVDTSHNNGVAAGVARQAKHEIQADGRLKFVGNRQGLERCPRGGGDLCALEVAVSDVAHNGFVHAGPTVRTRQDRVHFVEAKMVPTGGVVVRPKEGEAQLRVAGHDNARGRVRGG
ncbi:hypothetical protein H257_09099 [Aphanomyces astaci]|uniref:Uncharacterized protein n=1 Tax=Aphanomyces astaci TaxID=112090 RepID=W4GC02_APHAT|nr:hypothetical protein H257_09099 [Aphanomyces astaci]ETV77212.1 hypothetical protein H257_09099 [Aphanomyces astaci]|eukprot:XP_009833518.1 hypothetical protein H257_09099 [Aphanomyces astaci]